MPSLAAALVTAGAECGAGICFLLLAAYMLGRWRAEARLPRPLRVMSRRGDGSAS